jgi:hypothetical protein
LLDRLVRIHLGDLDAVAITLEHRGDAGKDDVVVVDERDSKWSRITRIGGQVYLPRGVPPCPSG